MQNAFKNKAYLAKLAAAQAEYERLKLEWDVVLDPIEEFAPVGARMAADAGGNWANEFLFKDLVKDVLKRASGKIHIAIVDTGYLPINEYIEKYVDKARCTNHINEPGADDHGHAHLCTGNLVANHPSIPMGVIRELAEANMVVITLHKGLNRQGAGMEPTLAAAVRAANAAQIPGVTHKIVSMSFGGQSFMPQLAAAIAEGQARGIFYSASAGNSGGTGNPSTVGVPARLAKVFNWGALKSDGTRDYYSSAGPELYAIAPGSGILSTSNTKNGLVAWSGTSSSNPIGVGLMACLLLMNPRIKTYEELDALIRAKITDAGAAGKDVLYGHGIPYLAPYMDQAPPPPPPPPSREYQSRRLEAVMALGASIPWRRISDTETKRFDLVYLKYGYTSTKPASEWKAIQARLAAYFSSVGIIIPDEWDVDQAIMWIGRFAQREIGLEYTGLQILEVQGGVEADRVLFEFGPENYAAQSRIMRNNVWPVAVWRL